MEQTDPTGGEQDACQTESYWGGACLSKVNNNTIGVIVIEDSNVKALRPYGGPGVLHSVLPSLSDNASRIQETLWVVATHLDGGHAPLNLS